MAYVDSDGETILETVPEITAFGITTRCSECREEAAQAVAFALDHVMVKIVFTTTCSHGELPPTFN